MDLQGQTETSGRRNLTSVEIGWSERGMRARTGASTAMAGAGTFWRGVDSAH